MEHIIRTRSNKRKNKRKVSKMDLEERIKLIEKIPTEEIVTNEELKHLLETKSKPLAYDGFEPSGMAHLGTGLMRAQKIKDLQKANIDFILYLADWHAMINNKLGGDLEKIQAAGNYLVKVWETLGVDTSKIKIKWASDFVSDPEYWKKVIQVSKNTTMKRMMRATTIMGRKEGELTDASQVLYPAMQVADIFHMDIDICQLGMDQRKANILAREIAPKLKYKKPVIVSHHLIMGLQGPQRMEMDAKMSKSKPNSSILVHDSAEAIKKKINKAYCPEKTIEENPLIEYSKYLIFRGEEKTIEIKRPEKFGGNLEIQNYQELENIYKQGKLHPMDLKKMVAEQLIEMLKPAREYFEKEPELLEIFKETK